MIIGVIKENQNFEKRVAATAATVKQLLKSNHSVIIEKDAGLGSFISNESYADAGAEIENTANDVYSKADIIFKVNAPTDNDLNY